MIYAKHPVLGNKHFPEGTKLEEGWVRWPRTKEEKAGEVKKSPTFTGTMTMPKVKRKA